MSQDTSGSAPVERPDPTATGAASPGRTLRRQPWRLLGAFLALSIAISVIGWWTHATGADHLRRKEYQQLKAMADFKAMQIDNWLAERRREAVTLAALPGFLADVERWQGSGDPAAGRRLARNLEAIRHNGNYRSIALLDHRGVPRLVLGAAPRGEAEAPTAPMERIAHLAEPQFIDLQRDGRSISLGHLLPLRAEGSGKALCYVRLTLDPREELYPLMQSWPTSSPSAETLVVRRDGDEVLFLNERRHRPGSALDFRLPLSRSDLPAAAAFNQGDGFFSGIDYRGVPVLAYLRPLAGTPWRLVVKVDEAELFSHVTWITRISIGAGLIAVGLNGLLFWSLWRKQSLRAKPKLWKRSLPMLPCSPRPPPGSEMSCWPTGAAAGSETPGPG